jgi:hypothetical protein
VQGEAGELNTETYPAWARIVWDFPEREGMQPVKFHWYEGRRDGTLVQPDRAMFSGVTFDDDKNKFPNSGALIVGEKGRLFQFDDYGTAWKLLPEGDFKDVKGPEPDACPAPRATATWR